MGLHDDGLDGPIVGKRFSGCGRYLVGIGVGSVDCDVGWWRGVFGRGSEELAGYLEGAAAIVICNKVNIWPSLYFEMAKQYSREIKNHKACTVALKDAFALYGREERTDDSICRYRR